MPAGNHYVLPAPCLSRTRREVGGARCALPMVVVSGEGMPPPLLPLFPLGGEGMRKGHVGALHNVLLRVGDPPSPSSPSHHAQPVVGVKGWRREGPSPWMEAASEQGCPPPLLPLLAPGARRGREAPARSPPPHPPPLCEDTWCWQGTDPPLLPLLDPRRGRDRPCRAQPPDVWPAPRSRCPRARRS